MGSNLPIGVQIKPPSNEPDTSFRRALPAGAYASHILHFDAPTSDENQRAEGATFTFSDDIVALIVSNSGAAGELLNDSDDIFGFHSTTFWTGNKSEKRRLEKNDKLKLVSSNQLRIQKMTVKDAGIDQFRVLTRVPEPGTAVLMSLGLVAFAWKRRRDK